MIYSIVFEPEPKLHKPSAKLDKKTPIQLVIKPNLLEDPNCKLVDLLRFLVSLVSKMGDHIFNDSVVEH
jgi:hypothetical protein